MTSTWLNNSGLKLEKFSADHFFNNELTISQPDKGYRFSMDPFILAAQIQPKKNTTLIDAGCGCGIISLILSFRYPNLKIQGIEIQKELFDFATRNIITNNLTNSIHLINTDLKKLTRSDIGDRADLIVSNPPYKKKDSGRLNPDTQKAIARHEITLDINALFECSDRLLKTSGELYIIFPADRISDLFTAMERFNFAPASIRFVHIEKNTGAKRVILCAVKQTHATCTIPPPFYVYTSDNIFTDEYLSMFKP